MIKLTDKEYNTKLYPIYKAIGMDLLFYYAIIFIFFTEVKCFDPAQVLFLDGLSPIFTMIFNLPATSIVERIGLKKGLIVGNILLSVFTVILIVAPNLYIVMIALLFNAFGFALKGITENNILAETVNVETKEGRYMFSVIESIGIRNYELLDGVTSFFTGLTFLINPYLPIMITLIFQVIAIMLATCFRIEPHKKKRNKKEKRESLLEEFKEIIKSKRIQALMLFILFFEGIAYSTFSLRETMLTESLEIPTAQFSIILAILTILGGVSTFLHKHIHKSFKNKSLAFLSLTYCVSMIISGALALSNINYMTKTIIILVIFLLQYSFRDIYLILIVTYSKNFTNNDIRVKVSSVVEAIRNISCGLISFFASLLLNFWSIDYTFIYMGISLGVILFVSLLWMRKHLGLEPEEYEEKDIFANY